MSKVKTKIAALLCVFAACAALFGIAFLGRNASAVAVENSDASVVGVELDARELADALVCDGSLALSGVVEAIVRLDGECASDKYTESGLPCSYGCYLSGEGGEERSRIFKEVDDFVTDASHDVAFEVGTLYCDLFKGFSVKTTLGGLIELASRGGVQSVTLSGTYDVCDDEIAEAETAMRTASQYAGTGTVVAVIDTSLDIYHEAFATAPEGAKFGENEDYFETLSNTYASSYVASPSALYVSSKIPFAFNYADDNLVLKSQQTHGTHVAGIAVGNGGGVTGAACDAQLVFCRVADDEGSFDDEAVVNALTDCLVLGVDVVNMSFGTPIGLDSDDSLLCRLIANLSDAGVSVVAAAGNNGASSQGSDVGDDPLAANTDYGTIGSPSSYGDTLAVAASAQSAYYILVDGKKVAVTDGADADEQTHIDFTSALGDGTFDYVFTGGFGDDSDYEGKSVNGKIAIVKRGNTSFVEKQARAAAHGAIGLLVVNNGTEALAMAVSKDGIPCASIGSGAEISQSGSIEISREFKRFSMSTYSAYGAGDGLTLKPDITALGDDVVSAISGGGIGAMSGTSMASPSVAGALASLKQYLRSIDSTASSVEINKRALRLLMSTASIARDVDGTAVSPRRQGAGVVNLDGAIASPSYLYTDVDSGFVKAQLGDDKSKSGDYDITLNVVNTSNVSVSYELSAETLTCASAGGKISSTAYVLTPEQVSFSSDGALTGNVLTLAAGQNAEVTVHISLSAADKSYIDDKFPSGCYVEGYVVFGGDIELSAPFLAYYGDWSKAPIFDCADDETSAYGGTSVYGLMGESEDGTLLPLGEYVYKQPDGAPTVDNDGEKAAVSVLDTSINAIYFIKSGLLRTAHTLTIDVTDDATGETVYSLELEDALKCMYINGEGQYIAPVILALSPLKEHLHNNAVYTLTMRADLGLDEQNNDNDEFVFKFIVDFEAPQIVSSTVRQEDGRTMLDVSLYDNGYVEALAVCGGKTSLFTTQLYLAEEYFRPVAQSVKGSVTTLTLDISEAAARLNGKVYVYVVDYALNYSAALAGGQSGGGSSGEGGEVNTPDDENLGFSADVLTLSPNQAADAAALLAARGTGALTWSTSDGTVAKVNGSGKVVALGGGMCALTVADGNGNAADIKIRVLQSGEEGYEEKLPTAATVFELKVQEIINGFGEKGLYFSQSGADLMLAVGESIRPSLGVVPFEANETLYDFDITSSNGALSVENGLIKALSVGAATLDVTVVNKTNAADSHNVKVSVVVKDRVVEEGVLTAWFGDARTVDLSAESDITALGADCFAHARNLNTVVLPDTLTRISARAFAGTSVISVSGGRVTSIGQFAFEDCAYLRAFDAAYAEYIGAGAFKNCISLTDFTVGDAVGSLGEETFAGCAELSHIKLGASLADVGRAAFAGCPSDLVWEVDNNRIIASEGCLMSKSGEVLATVGERITLSSDVSAIAPYAFEGNAALVYADFSNSSVTALEGGTFYGCTALKEVILPDALTSICESAFFGCKALTSLDFPSALTRIGSYAFAASGLKTVDVSACRLTLDDAAFALCTQLTYVDAGAVTQMGRLVFMGDANLKAVTFGEGTLAVGELAFANVSDGEGNIYELSALESVSLPFGVKEIGLGAFAYCGANLDGCDFGGVEKIGDSAFAGCTTLGNINFNSAVKVGVEAFANSSVTAAALGSARDIGVGAFEGAKGLTSVTLSHDGADIFIGERAFYNCAALGAVDLAAVKEVGDYAFYGTVIATAQLDAAEKIGVGAFAENDKLTALNMPVAESIGYGAFLNCNLGKVNLPTTLKQVGSLAFTGNKNLSFVAQAALGDVFTLKDGVLYAANPQGGLTLVCYPATLEADSYTLDIETTVIAGGAFAYNVALKSVEIGASVTTIGEAAFFGCKTLTNYTILSADAPTLLGNYSESGIYANFYGYGGSKTLSLTVPKGARGYNIGAWTSMFGTIKENGQSVDPIPDDKEYNEAQKSFISAVNSLATYVALADADKVSEARAMYDALSEEEKSMLDERYLNKLTTAEARISYLREQQENSSSGGADGDEKDGLTSLQIALIVTASVLGALVITLLGLGIAKHMKNKNGGKKSGGKFNGTNGGSDGGDDFYNSSDDVFR